MSSHPRPIAAQYIAVEELPALRWPDFVDGCAIIARSITQTNAGLEFKGTKSEKPRTVVLPPSAIVALDERRREQDAFRLQFGPDYCKDLDLIFANLDGGVSVGYLQTAEGPEAKGQRSATAPGFARFDLVGGGRTGASGRCPPRPQCVPYDTGRAKKGRLPAAESACSRRRAKEATGAVKYSPVRDIRAPLRSVWISFSGASRVRTCAHMYLKRDIGSANGNRTRLPPVSFSLVESK
jgi:hypothetical protein